MVPDLGLNPGPPALEASTIPLGYQGGGYLNYIYDLTVNWKSLTQWIFWLDTSCMKTQEPCWIYIHFQTHMAGSCISVSGKYQNTMHGKTVHVYMFQLW